MMAAARATSVSTATQARLRCYPIDNRRWSLRAIAVELEAAGHVTGAGTRYAAAAIARMVGA
jgi:hypothetical protein